MEQRSSEINSILEQIKNILKVCKKPKRIILNKAALMVSHLYTKGSLFGPAEDFVLFGYPASYDTNLYKSIVIAEEDEDNLAYLKWVDNMKRRGKQWKTQSKVQ